MMRWIFRLIVMTGGGQTRESLSRIASTSAAVARLDPARTETHVALSDYPLAGLWFDRVKAQGFAPDMLQNSRALDQSDQGSMTAICC